MVLFEPSNYFNQNITQANQVIGLRRYQKTASEHRGFLKNNQLQASQNSQNITVARLNRTHPRYNNITSSQNSSRTSVFSPITQEYRQNKVLPNQSGALPSNGTNVTRTIPSIMTSRRQLFMNNSTAGFQNSMANLHSVFRDRITAGSITNKRIQTNNNLNLPVRNSSGSLQSGTIAYSKILNSITSRTKLLVQNPTRNQTAFTPPPTMTLYTSQGVMESIVMNLPVNEHEDSTGKFADLYLKSNPTRMFETQLLP